MSISLLNLANNLLYPFFLIALCEARANTINFGVFGLVTRQIMVSGNAYLACVMKLF